VQRELWRVSSPRSAGLGGSYEGVIEIVAMDSMNQSNVLNPENTEMVHDICSEVREEAVGKADREGEVTGDTPRNFTPSRPPAHPPRD
jgi:hypothetical protein